MQDNLIYFPNLDIDLVKVHESVIKHQNNRSLATASHHRLAKDDEYLSSIRDRYPFLAEKYNIYTTKPYTGLPVHTDAKRNCALNIPIRGTQLSHTIFYEPVGELVTEYNPTLIVNKIMSPVKEIYRFTLTQPVIINNTIPHEVINKSSNTRVILSWSIDSKYTFADAVEMIKQYERIPN